MKSTDFNRNEGKLRVLQEVRPGKKKVNWDRIIYLLVLIIAFGAILMMVLKKNLYIRGEGQVLFKKLDIQLTEDVQITKFVFNEGDSVNVGDTLFFYYSEKMINSPRPVMLDQQLVVSNDNLDWIVRERLTTQKRIELANISISDAKRLISITVEEKKRIEHEVYLDIYPSTKLDQYNHRLIDLENQVVSQEEEIRFQKQYLEYLDHQERIERYNERKKMELEQASHRQSIPALQAYVSPVKGTITQIYKEDYEVALESDIILSVHKPTNLYIKAFYDQKDLRHLKEGDVVDVRFPDGSTSFGILQRFSFATYQLPEEFQKKYEPTTRSIVADILPVNELELEKWKAFYKLNVQISKPLFSTT